MMTMKLIAIYSIEQSYCSHIQDTAFTSVEICPGSRRMSAAEQRECIYSHGLAISEKALGLWDSHMIWQARVSCSSM